MIEAEMPGIAFSERSWPSFFVRALLSAEVSIGGPDGLGVGVAVGEAIGPDGAGEPLAAAPSCDVVSWPTPPDDVAADADALATPAISPGAPESDPVAAASPDPPCATTGPGAPNPGP